MQKIRQKNRQKKGPWLVRSDEIHAKAMNMMKSVGFSVKMDGLTSIELLMTNFN